MPGQINAYVFTQHREELCKWALLYLECLWNIYSCRNERRASVYGGAAFYNRSGRSHLTHTSVFPEKNQNQHKAGGRKKCGYIWCTSPRLPSFSYYKVPCSVSVIWIKTNFPSSAKAAVWYCVCSVDKKQISNSIKLWARLSCFFPKSNGKYWLK